MVFPVVRAQLNKPNTFHTGFELGVFNNRGKGLHNTECNPKNRTVHFDRWFGWALGRYQNHCTCYPMQPDTFVKF